VLPTDDARHTAGAAPGWCESWYFDFATAGGTGGAVQLALWPHDARAWYWACFVEPGQGPVLVRDQDVGLPRAPSLEIRAEGLWAECVLEAAFEHWSLGLEAFGVRLDDPLDAFRGERGERLPIGLDLSWEATVPAHAPDVEGRATDGYVQAGRVYGDVLVGDRRIDIDARGLRAHTWGEPCWLDPPWWWVGAATDDGGAFSLVTFGEDSPITGTHVTVGEEHTEVDVVAWAPLAVDRRDGSSKQLWRALCNVRGPRVHGPGWAAWMPATTEQRPADMEGR
jgi:hypothetical protein